MADQKMRHNSLSDRAFYVVHRYSRAIGYALFTLIISSIVVLGYYMWMKECNKAAQNYFGMLALEYEHVKRTHDGDLGELLAKFQAGFDQHSRASVTPFYKNYAVKILIEQNNYEQARALLEKVIEGAPSHLVPLYTMERALIELDSNDADIQKNAEQTLRTLAYDKKNQFKDEALFYLGRYYWVNDNLDQAREAWQTLVDEQADEKAAPSPWAQHVQEYLTLTIV